MDKKVILLTCSGEACTFQPDSNLIRSEKEIRHKMEQTPLDFDTIQTALFRLAAQKYACCQYDDSGLKTAQPQHQMRTKPNGSKVCCEGFTVRNYSDRYRKALLEQVSLAVGYELLNNDPAEAEQLVSDYLATGKAAYRTLLKNEGSYEEKQTETKKQRLFSKPRKPAPKQSMPKVTQQPKQQKIRFHRRLQ